MDAARAASLQVLQGTAKLQPGHDELVHGMRSVTHRLATVSLRQGSHKTIYISVQLEGDT